MNAEEDKEENIYISDEEPADKEKNLSGISTFTRYDFVLKVLSVIYQRWAVYWNAETLCNTEFTQKYSSSSAYYFICKENHEGVSLENIETAIFQPGKLIEFKTKHFSTCGVLTDKVIYK